MAQTGVVRRIEADRVWVEINCVDCAPGELAPSCCADARATIEARAPVEAGLAVGDAVELEPAGTGSLVLLGVLAFGVPLAGLFAAYAAAAALGVASDAGRAGLGFAGLALGALAPILWFRFRKPRDERPLARPR